MTDLIALAKQAKATTYTNRHYPERPFVTFSPEQLQAFADALVQREREKYTAANRVNDLYSGAGEDPPVFGRRWKLAVDGFGLQRDDNGPYVHIDDALSVLHESIRARTTT